MNIPITNILLVSVLFMACTNTSRTPKALTPEPAKYTCATTPSWADEFDYQGLPDETKWGYDVGTGQDGWGNNEWQYYTEKRPDNVRVGDGVLTITAILEDYEGQKYT